MIHRDRTKLLQGTLDLLILKTLRSGELHGWGISKTIRERSSDVFEIHQGSLYPALYRLENKGLIEAHWGVSTEHRRAKFYSLTDSGDRVFDAEEESWRAFSGAVDQILNT